MDHANLLEQLIALFDDHGIRYLVIGGQAVNAYAEPLVSLEDVLRGKIWAVQDSECRGSKRQKDLADIARLIEAYPELRNRVPEEILARLL